jgi:hypothetical protein
MLIPEEEKGRKTFATFNFPTRLGICSSRGKIIMSRVNRNMKELKGKKEEGKWKKFRP